MNKKRGWKSGLLGVFPLDNLISAADVARMYGLHENTVKEAIKRGTIPGKKIGREYITFKDVARRRWDISDILTDGDWNRRELNG